MDIANYVIVLSNQSAKTIINLKLQKLFYYLNAKYLVYNNDRHLHLVKRNFNDGHMACNAKCL